MAREFALMEMIDGAPQRDHIESQRRQNDGIYPEGWEPIEPPRDAVYLWGYWQSMNRRRPRNGMAVSPISQEGVIAWQLRRGVVLHSVEEEALDAIEGVYIHALDERAAQEAKRKK